MPPPPRPGADTPTTLRLHHDVIWSVPDRRERLTRRLELRPAATAQKAGPFRERCVIASENGVFPRAASPRDVAGGPRAEDPRHRGRRIPPYAAQGTGRALDRASTEDAGGSRT